MFYTQQIDCKLPKTSVLGDDLQGHLNKQNTKHTTHTSLQPSIR